MDLLTPPPERDLPVRRVAELRARVMAGTRQRTHPGRRAALVTAAVVAVVAGGAGVATTIGGEGTIPRVLAFAPGELSPELESTVDKCLFNNSPESKDPSSLAHDPRLPVTRADFVVGVQHGDTRAVAFVTGEGYLTCQYKDAGEGSFALSVDRWQGHRREWLPGPAEQLLLVSSEPEGGDVSVIGRVSASVNRLVLEYGDGHSSRASLGGGMFALLSDGHPVRRDAALVSFDANGREIGRARLFEGRDRDACFTDPAGNVVYGTMGEDCRPAYRWR